MAKKHKSNVQSPPVQPLQSSPTAPVAPSEPTPPAPPKKTGEVCWNCKNQGEDNRLDEDGQCAVCGFDKSTLYNGNIEADKAAQRVEAAQAAERGL